MRFDFVSPATDRRDPDKPFNTAQADVAAAFGFPDDSSATTDADEQEDVFDWTDLGTRNDRVNDDESDARPATVVSPPAADLTALQAEIAAVLGARS